MTYRSSLLSSRTSFYLSVYRRLQVDQHQSSPKCACLHHRVCTTELTYCPAATLSANQSHGSWRWWTKKRGKICANTTKTRSISLLTFGQKRLERSDGDWRRRVLSVIFAWPIMTNMWCCSTRHRSKHWSSARRMLTFPSGSTQSRHRFSKKSGAGIGSCCSCLVFHIHIVCRTLS